MTMPVNENLKNYAFRKHAQHALRQLALRQRAVIEASILALTEQIKREEKSAAPNESVSEETSSAAERKQPDLSAVLESQRRKLEFLNNYLEGKFSDGKMISRASLSAGITPKEFPGPAFVALVADNLKLIHCALLEKNIEYAGEMIEMGAKLTTVDADGQTVMEALSQSREGLAMLPKSYATASIEELRVILTFLMEKGKKFAQAQDSRLIDAIQGIGSIFDTLRVRHEKEHLSRELSLAENDRDDFDNSDDFAQGVSDALFSTETDRVHFIEDFDRILTISGISEGGLNSEIVDYYKTVGEKEITNARWDFFYESLFETIEDYADYSVFQHIVFGGAISAQTEFRSKMELFHKLDGLTRADVSYLFDWAFKNFTKEELAGLEKRLADAVCLFFCLEKQNLAAEALRYVSSGLLDSVLKNLLSGSVDPSWGFIKHVPEDLKKEGILREVAESTVVLFDKANYESTLKTLKFITTEDLDNADSWNWNAGFGAINAPETFSNEHMSLFKTRLGAVEYLIAKGEHAEALKVLASKVPQTALRWAPSIKHSVTNKFFNAALYSSLGKGFPAFKPLLVSLIEMAPIDVLMGNAGNTILHLAATHGSSEKVQELMDALQRTDVNIPEMLACKDERGKTPLEIARERPLDAGILALLGQNIKQERPGSVLSSDGSEYSSSNESAPPDADTAGTASLSSSSEGEATSQPQGPIAAFFTTCGRFLAGIGIGFVWKLAAAAVWVGYTISQSSEPVSNSPLVQFFETAFNNYAPPTWRKSTESEAHEVSPRNNPPTFYTTQSMPTASVQSSGPQPPPATESHPQTFSTPTPS